MVGSAGRSISHKLYINIMQIQVENPTIARAVVGALLLVVLTLMTQVGGLALGLAWAITRFAFPKSMQGWHRGTSTAALFLVLYAGLGLLVIPAWAALGGRVPLPCHAGADRPFAAAHPTAGSIATMSTSAWWCC
jgi:hypothetical protein